MKSRFVCMLFLAFIYLQQTNASHLIGANITYEYTPSGTIFRLKVYADCNGAGIQPIAPICFTSPSGCSPDIIFDLAYVSNFEVPFNPCAGPGTTSCNGGFLHSFHEFTYEGLFTPPPCSDWIVSINYCCRNIINTNLVNGPGTITVETTMDNLNYPTNSSPAFNNMPLNYYCIGHLSVLDYSATDIDGDSLVYEFVPVLEGTCGATVNVPTLPAYSYDQPLATSSPAILDTLGGQILFTPSAIQNSAVGFRVNEYRNGMLIGSVRREDAIVAVNGPTTIDTIAGRVFYDMNLDVVFNAGDIPAANFLVQVGPGIAYVTTSSIGKYDMVVPPAFYNITFPNLPPYMNLVTTSYAITTSGIGAFYGNNDFALQPIPGKNDLVININSYNIPGPGLPYSLFVNYENIGTTVQNNADVTVTVDPGLTFAFSVPPPNSSTGNSFTWNISTLNALESGSITIHTLIDSSIFSGQQITCLAAISSPVTDENPLDNTDSFTVTYVIPVQVPYDPNNKEVIPAGDLPLSFITSQQWLNYKINFQNTGTGFAQVAKIEDQLDFDLDFGSLELVSSSFPCVISMQNFNDLEFTFFGINLPPASLNEPASHGFIEYRIKPKVTVPVGSMITNAADIIFDLNAPITTNLVHNKVVLSTGGNEIETADLNMVVYPNPAENAATLSVTNYHSEKATITINNLMGQIIFEKQVTLQPGENYFEIPLTNTAAGIYVVNLIKLNDYAVTRLVVK